MIEHTLELNKGVEAVMSTQRLWHASKIEFEDSPYVMLIFQSKVDLNESLFTA